MLAAMGGHTLTVKAFIGGGADPNIQGLVSRSDCSTAVLCYNVLLQSQSAHFLAYPLCIFERISMYMICIQYVQYLLSVV